MSTIKEVALKAGVSTATVSRILNGKGTFSSSTEERVLSAVKELGYKPSRVARNLRVQRTQLIGLIISDIQNPFFTSVIRGVEEVAYQHDYSVILCNSDEDSIKEQMYLTVMHEENVAGIILATTLERGHDEKLICCEIPVVAIDRTIDNIGIDTILVDNILGAREAVAHLIKLGHNRIGLIGGLEHVSTARERQLGYERAHHEFGISLDQDLMKSGNFKQISGYKIAMELLTLRDRPSALFIANNLMTLGALNAIHSLGLNIPRDVAVVGFDDMPWAISLNPPLTVVAQPDYELGKFAGELLLKRIADQDLETKQIRLIPKLVIRESCGSKLKSIS
jgi:LacI family transcriptional regulator